ncbi:MAG: methyltransferase domain-containing protein [Desulfamplus sp.]|nr:methyltransferase domain-containing protein [Desulfamplus sp.]
MPQLVRDIESLFEQVAIRSLLSANQQETTLPNPLQPKSTKNSKEPNQLKYFLHVGCGLADKKSTTPAFSSDNWEEIRFDIDKAVSPDILGTMTDMGRVADSSVDAIFSSHNIEHLYPHEVQTALHEFLRVLKEDGFAIITCPDLQSIAALIVDNKLTEPAYHSPAGAITPLDMLYGHRQSMEKGNLFMAHRCGFTKDSLIAALQEAGFGSVGVIARSENFDLWAVASKQNLTSEEFTKLVQEQFT